MASIGLIGVGPQPGRIILCKRVVAAPSPSYHVFLSGHKTSVLPLLAMAKRQGRLEASLSAVRTFDVGIAGLQARLAIVEAVTP